MQQIIDSINSIQLILNKGKISLTSFMQRPNTK